MSTYPSTYATSLLNDNLDQILLPQLPIIAFESRLIGHELAGGILCWFELRLQEGLTNELVSFYEFEHTCHIPILSIQPIFGPRSLR